MNKEEILSLKIKNIHKKIYGDLHFSDILNEVEYLLNFIEKNYKNLELIKAVNEIVDFLSIKLVIEKEEYINSFYKLILNYYFKLLKMDNDSFLSLIFSIILKNYGYIINFEIVKIILKHSKKISIIKFPLDMDENIYHFFLKTKDLFISLFNTSSSYTLFRNSIIRNKIVLYLYDYYKKNKKLTLFFRFSGIGIEPLMFLYIIRLLFEIEYNKTKLDIKVYCYDQDIELLYNCINSSLFDNIFLKLKEEICKENCVKVKDIVTSLKLCKKDIMIVKELNAISENIDFIIINNILIAQDSNLLLKELNYFYNLFNDIKILIEMNKNIEIDKKFLYEARYKFLQEICSELDERTNKVIAFFILQKFINKEERINKREKDYSEDIITLFNNVNNLKISELKKKVNSIKIKSDNLTSIEILKYAFLLSVAGYHSKSFEIIKKYYNIDYKFSYKILKEIISKTKNKKLKNSVEMFIKTNQLLEKGFSAELIEAINDEIETFFEKKEKKIKEEDYL